jgi:hypothetical protein
MKGLDGFGIYPTHAIFRELEFCAFPFWVEYQIWCKQGSKYLFSEKVSSYQRKKKENRLISHFKDLVNVYAPGAWIGVKTTLAASTRKHIPSFIYSGGGSKFLFLYNWCL